MDSVKSRLQSVLPVLLVLLVMGASVQSAVCQMSCALRSARSGCHRSAEGSDHVQAMSACLGNSMNDAGAERAGDLLGGCQHGACLAGFGVVGVEKANPAEVMSATVPWVVVGTLPRPWRLLDHLCVERRITAEDHPSMERLVRLRV